MSSTTDIPKELVQHFRKWKTSRKFNRAFIMKINQEKLVVELESEREDLEDIEELAEELPYNVPRFVVYTTRIVSKDSGYDREQFPMVFLFWKPPSSIELNSLYSSTKNALVGSLEVLKYFDVDEPEQLTHEWLLSKILKK
eukprot:TRINITY_DN3555_c0_g1_i4.p1 TRINITY_DN3555_c0_g1~~TRINITY_DN3555_c0_g1_i4.p1  ORF type:complete len:141 (-),score=21.31 TRINITY_DN3555_c0_g1_i4:60-482(-)